MNVLKDLIDSKDKSNKILANEMATGIFKNALTELVQEHFGKILFDQGNDFMVEFTLELTTVNIYNRRSNMFTATMGSRIFILTPMELLESVDFDVDRLPNRIEEYILNLENSIGGTGYR